MKKPPHALALVLWAAAVVVVGLEIPVLAAVFDMVRRMAGPEQLGEAQVSAAIWMELRSGLKIVAEFIFAAVTIELLDHIRWRLTPENERAASGRRYLARRLSASRTAGA